MKKFTIQEYLQILFIVFILLPLTVISILGICEAFYYLFLELS